MSIPPTKPKPITVPDFLSARSRGTRLAVLTAYDYTFARLLDEAGVDAILVGDSLGMVIQGHANALPVTLDEMIYHTRCVARGTSRAMIITDMPFMTFQLGPKQALESAGRLVKEGGTHAVKLEGVDGHEDVIQRFSSHRVNQLGELGINQEVTIGGMLTQVRYLNTKKARSGNTRYCRCKLEDFTGSVECVIWPDDYLRFKDVIAEGHICFVVASVERTRAFVSRVLSA